MSPHSGLGVGAAVGAGGAAGDMQHLQPLSLIVSPGLWVIQGGTPCSGAGSHCFVLSMVSVSPFLPTLLLKHLGGAR